MGLDFIRVPSITGSEKGEVLRVYENSAFPVSLERVFSVTADRGAERGRHAHKRCTQILSCVAGEVDLLLDNGSHKVSARLSTNSDAVLIPPGVWAEQTYLQDRSVLLVLCDQPYDEDDYLRDYNEFIEWKSVTA